MKILAIRGRNLASLAGHFEVDFTKAPLDRAGLIAITGPTGAGKTTLLDAMCLALFDRTPRFANRGGVVIGGASDDPTAGIKANDVRGILRHGAVEGWAEVEFRGVDERVFRARWEVRRARSKTEGRIQPQHLELLDGVTGRPIVADRKQDVLDAIEQRLGLDFDQFRRSVLLAQGEFAAFLEANGAERAELLERMTGTGLYRTLGKASWERAKQVERELELLRREREGLFLLDEAERERLRERAGTLDGRRRSREREREQALAALEWHRRRAALLGELDTALAEQAEREREFAALAELRALLHRLDRAAPLRPRVDLVEQLAAEQGERREELEFLRGELVLFDTQQREARDALARDEERLEQARERRRRIGHDLDRARELDARRGELEPRCRAARDEAHTLAGALAKHGLERELLLANLAGHEQVEREAAAWLAERAELGRLADAWSHLRPVLLKQAREAERAQVLATRVRELEPRIAAREAEVGEAKLQLAALKKQRAQVHARVRKYERELDELPAISLLRARARAIDRLRVRLVELRELFAAHQRCMTAIGEATRERSDEQAELLHRKSEVARVERDLGHAEAAFAEARGALARLEAVRDLASRRDDLREGEPCPLCGALDHPAARGHGEPIDQAIEEQRIAVERLLLRRDDLQREQGDHEARVAVAGKRIVQLDAELRELEGQRVTTQTKWTQRRDLAGLALVEPVEGGERAANDAGSEQLLLLSAGSSAKEPELPTKLGDPRCEAALWAVQERHEARARALGHEQQRVDDVQASHRTQQHKRDELDEQLERSRSECETLERECAALVRELERAREQAEELDEELRERDEQLAAVLVDLGGREAWAGWRTRLLVGGEGGPGMPLVAALEQALAELQAQRAREREARRAREGLEPRRVELDSRIATRREQQTLVEQERRELEQALAELDAQRAALLEGRSVAEVQRELEAAVELSLRDRDAGKDRLAAVERDRQAHKARIAALEARLEELREDAEAAVGALALAMQQLGIARPELDELLASPTWSSEAWQAEQRASVERARAALERQTTLVGERRRVLEVQGEPPNLDREAAEGARVRLDAELRGVAGEQFEVEHRLRSDADARTRASELLPRIAATEQRARVWARLRDAIGDATGSRFQQFAQSLTLELLLAQANAQLRELKPRYALGRVPGHDLELQLVDRDLGDEVRSIRGLSGGEKFLVSLALALALASLAAEDCRIDSLFIDEGFGTLDAHSLDVAVGTLDALHGEGRQIGVISHVPGLAERIGVEIRVEPVSSGRSRVRVVA